MAENNLKDFTTNLILGGALMFCLIAFAITFTLNNNPIGLNDGTGDVLGVTASSYNTQLGELNTDSDTLLNITANTNPEASQLGSRDIVATGFGAKSTATSSWENAKNLISWIFAGEIGKMLLVLIGGLIGLGFYFYITKHIRTGD